MWPSADFPGNGEKVGTYPFFGHHPNREYSYLICPSDFPAEHRNTWYSLIENAFEQWEKATNGFIKMTRVPLGPRLSSCSDESISMEQFVITDDQQSEVRMLDLSEEDGESIWRFPELKSDVFKGICAPKADACVTSFTGYTGIGYDHSARQAILLLLQGEELDLLDYPKIHNLLRRHSHDRQAENQLQSVDVTFNRRDDDGDERFQLPMPSDPNSGDLHIPSRVSFNTCSDDLFPDGDDPDQGYRAYMTAVHEAGHALGLADITINPFAFLLSWSLPPYETAHPTIPDAAMNYDSKVASNLREPDCSPHPFDVMAIYALYQKLRRS